MAFRLVFRRLSSAASRFPSFTHLQVDVPSPFVVHVSLNRPDKFNALNDKLWQDIDHCFSFLSVDKDCRAIVFSGNGKFFCAGMDLSGLANIGTVSSDTSLDVARKAFKLRQSVIDLQRRFYSLETEVDMGITADVGALQKLPKVIGNDSLFRELVFTARKVTAEEAVKLSLVSQVFEDKETMMEAAKSVAAIIAQKSPVAVQGSKLHLNFSRDHSANWNMSMLQGDDVVKAITAAVMKEKTPPTFDKL
ncbi:unnamed protein product [Soboliphyme baturini]|uniref:3-hydroxyisobutyryl-coenzyme A hydrolase n=1 Tax=Soboliphyme baturini TaxID=241478 RepID=A0A183IH59_9BILA|nr:unnamed protein product [Soboliphyme baturini]